MCRNIPAAGRRETHRKWGRLVGWTGVWAFFCHITFYNVSSPQTMLVFESLEVILLRTASDLSHFNMVGNGIVKKIVANHMKLLQGSLHSANHRWVLQKGSVFASHINCSSFKNVLLLQICPSLPQSTVRHGVPRCGSCSRSLQPHSYKSFVRAGKEKG